jgi:hypothetical protein
MRQGPVVGSAGCAAATAHVQVWPEQLRRFHSNQPPFAGDAVALVRELREERE